MTTTTDTKPREPNEATPDIIAIRRTCDAEGTGLSHYVLMDNPAPDIIAIRKTCDAEGTGLSHYVLMDERTER